MLKQLDGSLSVSISFDSWLRALPLTSLRSMEATSLQQATISAPGQLL